MDAGQLLQRLVEGARSDLDPANISVELEVDPGAKRIWADPHQLRPVFQNLLANARTALVRHRPAEERTVRASVDPTPDGGVAVVIEDTGPGLPEEVLQDLFIPFVRSQGRSGGGDEDGTLPRDPDSGSRNPSRGLGLSVSHGIVRRHGGTIHGQNASHGGARFVIHLPAVASGVEAPTEKAPPAAGTEPPSPAPHGRILVVEDDPLLASAVARALERWGWTPVVTHRAEEALEALAGDPDGWAAILSDFRMPGMGGRGLWTHVDEERPDLRDRFVFTTGDLVDPDTHDFVRRSGRPVLMKPYELKELRELVRRVAGGSAPSPDAG